MLLHLKPLVREFDFVPDPTNVYTAYDVTVILLISEF